MRFDMDKLAGAERYKLLASSVTPRPIAWVTSLDPDGRLNTAPYSFFNVMGHTPPTVVLGFLVRETGEPKDTPANILAGGEFVVNLVSEADAAAMNATCIDAPPGWDEASYAGLDLIPSDHVAPPRIASAPVSMECRLLQAVHPGPQQIIVIGEVVTMHVADHLVLDADRCHLDTPAMGLVGRVHGAGWYARTTDLFQLERPRFADVK
ncbi:flavin reductase family protein [Sphingomonas sanxanigenens]|uniref:Flavin reductase like domain-containing protein n=1 Tax=Sphingomonas sanxanigenens DSM 19645 = NX02 TaxID=1123269 RepID=W0ABX7_9SPHN|nr:flavin reductase family protein [Sphingomonas sanxanigenens]AHE53992.1 hypothetical protein NX02_11405 [Sphingomonas sanxanigenens DSM 19645 = NX02]